MKKNDFRKILASYFSFSSSLYIVAITFCDIPVANMDLAKIILGFILGSTLGVIIGFYFGDSEQKKDSDDIQG